MRSHITGPDTYRCSERHASQHTFSSSVSLMVSSLGFSCTRGRMTLVSWGTFCKSSLLLSPALGLLLRFGKITSLALYALSLAAFSCSNALGCHVLEAPSMLILAA